MRLESERLYLDTISVELLDAAAVNDVESIEKLGYKTNGEWPEKDFLEAIPYFRGVIVRNNGTRGFDSWIICDKATKEIIGGIGFFGNPDEYGNIELGFGINESKRRKGYCFEAATELISWAVNHEDIKMISAKCLRSNTESINILTKLNFRIEKRDDEYIYWKYIS